MLLSLHGVRTVIVKEQNNYFTRKAKCPSMTFRAVKVKAT